VPSSLNSKSMMPSSRPAVIPTCHCPSSLSLLLQLDLPVSGRVHSHTTACANLSVLHVGGEQARVTTSTPLQSPSALYCMHRDCWCYTH
jgi:hypothetical protein